MRSLIFVLLLAAHAFGDERTWTIATGVHTTQAELVGVRGDVAYLKTGDKVEPVPIANLSPADQAYIASLPLAPVPQVPAAAPATDILPVPTPPATAAATSGPVLTSPTAPPVTEEAIPLPGEATIAPRTQVAPRTPTAPRSSTTTRPVPRSAGYRATSTQSLNANTSNANNVNNRRYVQPQTSPQSRRSVSAQRTPPEPPPGLLNFRARRQRGR
jgi:hypothetical protein